MGKALTRVATVGAGGGAVLVFAAQTKPEDAMSNLAGWLKLLGVDRAPAFLASTGADTVATVAGIIVAAVSAIILWRSRQRKSDLSPARSGPRIGRAKDPDIDLLIQEMRRSDRRAVTRGAAGRAQEVAEAWAQGAAEDAGSPARMPISDVVKRVAYLSHWAEQFEECDSYDYMVRYLNDPWKLLMREVCRPLTMGDIETWGIKRARNGPADNGPTKIEAGFWTRAEFYPEHMLTESSIGSAVNGDLGLTYTNIVFDKAGVDRAWPIAGGGKPSPFVKIFAEWRAKENAKHRQHEAWLNREHQQTQERRRSLIEEGRKIVVGHDDKSGEDDRLYLETHPAFLQIRKYLSEGLQQQFSSDAIHVELDGGRVHVGMLRAFSRELDRLETEWELDL